MHWCDGAAWGQAAMMWIWLALGVLAAAAVVVFLFRVASWTSRRHAADDDPETIVKRRYARGEIDEEEMERRLDRIHGT